MLKVRIDPLDKLASEYIRKRSRGYCERCGKFFGWENLQCCHFHSRRKRSVRYDTDNLMALDFGCHSYLDGNPLEKIEFFKNRLGEQAFDYLNARSRVPARFIDKEAIGLYLKEQIRQLETVV